jgi:hypothetical protein
MRTSECVCAHSFPRMCLCVCVGGGGKVHAMKVFENKVLRKDLGQEEMMKWGMENVF